MKTNATVKPEMSLLQYTSQINKEKGKQAVYQKQPRKLWNQQNINKSIINEMKNDRIVKLE